MQAFLTPTKAQLEAFGEWLAKTSAADRNGASRATHLARFNKYQEKLGKSTWSIEPPELDPNLGYLITTYAKVRAVQGAGMNGLEPISYSEWDAYCRLMKDELETYELELLIALDLAFVRTVNLRQAKDDLKPKKGT